MEQGDDRPAAMVLLLRDGEQLLLGPVHGPVACDIEFVEDLLRVQLAARRFGWSIRITAVRADVLELVDLVGLRADLVG